MASTNTLRMTLGYVNSNQKRNYDFDISEEYISGAKAKVIAINDSLSGGTAGGFSSFFVDDAGNNLARIENLKLYRVTEEVIDLGGE